MTTLAVWRRHHRRTEFDPPYFEVIGKHLQLSYLWGVHGGGIFRVSHVLPLSVGFHLCNTGAPRGLISREESRGQRRETVA